MINEHKRQQLEAKANAKLADLQEKNPDCNFSVLVYDAGTREGEVVVQKENPEGQITDYVIGSAQEH